MNNNSGDINRSSNTNDCTFLTASTGDVKEIFDDDITQLISEHTLLSDTSSNHYPTRQTTVGSSKISETNWLCDEISGVPVGNEIFRPVMRSKQSTVTVNSPHCADEVVKMEHCKRLKTFIRKIFTSSCTFLQILEAVRSHGFCEADYTRELIKRVAYEVCDEYDSDSKKATKSVTTKIPIVLSTAVSGSKRKTSRVTEATKDRTSDEHKPVNKSSTELGIAEKSIVGHQNVAVSTAITYGKKQKTHDVHARDVEPVVSRKAPRPVTDILPAAEKVEESVMFALSSGLRKATENKPGFVRKDFTLKPTAKDRNHHSGHGIPRVPKKDITSAEVSEWMDSASVRELKGAVEYIKGRLWKLGEVNSNIDKGETVLYDITTANGKRRSEKGILYDTPTVVGKEVYHSVINEEGKKRRIPSYSVLCSISE